MMLVQGEKNGVDENREKGSYAEKEAGEENAGRCCDQRKTAPFLQSMMHGEQCPEQKGKVVHEHDVVMTVEDDRCRQQVEHCHKKGQIGNKPFPQPEIAEKCTEQRQQDVGDLQVRRHRQPRKRKGQQDHRTVQSVVGEIENILSAAQLHGEIGKEIAGGIETGAEVFRNGKVLVAPVRLCPVYTAGVH